MDDAARADRDALHRVRLLDHPAGALDTCFGVWLGLGGALAVLLGAWLGLNDERPTRRRTTAAAGR